MQVLRVTELGDGHSSNHRTQVASVEFPKACPPFNAVTVLLAHHGDRFVLLPRGRTLFMKHIFLELSRPTRHCFRAWRRR